MIYKWSRRKEGKVSDNPNLDQLGPVEIKQPEEYWEKQVSDLIENKEYNDAITLLKQLQDDDYDDLVWRFIKLFDASRLISIDDLKDMYRYIPYKSTHYSMAQERLTEVIKEEYRSELAGLIRDEQYPKALTLLHKIHKEGYVDVFWEFSKMLYQNKSVSSQELIDLLQKIPEKSNYYQEAQRDLALLSLGTDNEEGRILAFIAALGGVDQPWINQLFDELSGGGSSGIDIQANAETLIALAQQIKTLRKEVAELKSDMTQRTGLFK